MNTTDNIGMNRKLKDRLLRLLFTDKERALELYNGLNQSDYTDANALEITTLEDVIYMKMKNDISILLDGRLQLYEHQSTYNPNMPMRGLLYFADLYRQLLKGKHIYSTKLLKVPTPMYVVLYNGSKEIGEEEWLKLSDAFTYGNEQSGMELRAHMININHGHNQELMKRCKTLNEYAIFVDKIKCYSANMEFAEAVDKAIVECIDEDVLREFLMTRRAEVMNALLTEYDEEQVLADIGQEKYEDGYEDGQQKGQEEVNLLTKRLIEDDRFEDLKRAVEDKEFQQALFKEYEIE